MYDLIVALCGQGVVDQLTASDLASLEVFIFILILYCFFNVAKTLVRGVM